MARHRNVNWLLHTPENSEAVSFSEVHTALFMDIRETLQATQKTLQAIQSIFECENAQAIPGLLRAIQRNTLRKRALR